MPDAHERLQGLSFSTTHPAEFFQPLQGLDSGCVNSIRAETQEVQVHVVPERKWYLKFSILSAVVAVTVVVVVTVDLLTVVIVVVAVVVMMVSSSNDVACHCR